MQRQPSGPEFVWDELDLLLDEKGPIVGNNTNTAAAGAAPVPGVGGPPENMMVPGNWSNTVPANGVGFVPPLPYQGGDPMIPGNMPFVSANNMMPAQPIPGAVGPKTTKGRGRKAAGEGKVTGKRKGGAGSSKAGSSANSVASDEVDEKEAKRRAAVAAASRATRAKRKRELEELKEKNIRLEKERETFLNTIADLQMKVQALRETGSIDLRMENDLLRAELMEHKSFISRFKRIADGMPTTKSAKKLMCKQGSDTAIAQVLGLLSTSMADPSWKVGMIRNHPEIDFRYQRLPHGVLAENAKRCSIRIDIPVIPIDCPEKLASIIWKTWCDEEMNKRISKHFGAVSVSVREIETGLDQEGTLASSSSSSATPGPSPAVASTTGASTAGNLSSSTSATSGESSGGGDGKLTRNSSKRVKTEKGQSIGIGGVGIAPDLEVLHNQVKVYYYREETPRSDLDAAVNGSIGANDVVDTVLLLSSRKKKVSRSSFPADERFHVFPPKNLLAPEQFTQHGPYTLEQQQGLQAQRNYDAIVLASTSTQHSLGLVPVKPGVHRIRSALLEGSIFRKVDGGVSMTSVFSYPSTEYRSKHDVLVTNDGYLNNNWTNVVEEVVNIMRENIPQEVYDAYKKAASQGLPLPKMITDYF